MHTTYGIRALFVCVLFVILNTTLNIYSTGIDRGIKKRKKSPSNNNMTTEKKQKKDEEEEKFYLWLRFYANASCIW